METIILYITIECIAVIFMALAYKYKNEIIELNIFDKYPIKIKISIAFLIISFIPLFLLIALRHQTVGTDYRVYIDAYRKIATETLNTRENSWLGIGFIFTVKLFVLIFKENYIVYFSVLGFATLFLFYKSFWENSKKPALSLFIFISFCLYYQLFNQFRQMFAIAIVLYSIKYIKQKKLLKYIVWILIATSFHKSAIIVLPMYFIAKVDFNKKIWLIYSILAIVSFFSIDIIKLLMQETYYGKIYFSSNYDIGGKLSSIFNLIFRLGLLGGCLFFYPKLRKMDKNNLILYHAAMICTIIQIITLRSYLFGRVTTYFFIFYTLLIPEVLEIISDKKKIKNYMLLLSCIGLCIYHMIYFNSSSAEQCGYTTYRFLYEKGNVR